MIIVVTMRNDVIYVSKMRKKMVQKGGYATYGATLSRLVELY